MWTIKELKALGKQAFKNNYWVSVVAALILGIAIAGVTTYLSVNTGQDFSEASSNSSMTFSIVAVTSSIVTLLLNTFVFRPLEIGGRHFFLNNSDGCANIYDFLDGFRFNYLNNVLTMFLRDLFVALWTMLFIIPGIVKMYAYSLVPYILAENPEIGAMDAIKLSNEMMKGHKMNAFLLDLSFIGWILLTILTFGLVGVFFANPYMYATDAELYKAIKADYERRTHAA